MPRETPRKPTIATDSKAADPYAELRGPDKPVNAVEWDRVSAAIVHMLICSVTTAGHAITFGRSRDGGALSATIHFDGGKYSIRQHTAEEMMDALMAATEVAGKAAARFDPRQQ